MLHPHQLFNHDHAGFTAQHSSTADAAPRRGAHQRLRNALRMLTGTRSFHNFCPRFKDSSDGKSVRSVYRCRSGMTAAYHRHQSSDSNGPACR